MRTFWELPLRRQLLVVNLLLLVPVVALAIWSTVATYRDRASDVINDARMVAQTTSTYIDRDLRYMDGLARAMADDPVVRSSDSAKASDRLAQMIFARAAVVATVVTADGREFARAVRSEDAYDPPVFTEAVMAPVRRPFGMGADSGTVHLAFGYPVHFETSVRGALWLFVDMQRLQQALEESPLPPGSVVLIADAQGRVIAGNNHGATGGSGLLRTSGGPHGDAGEVVTVEGSDGVVRLQVEATASQGPWQVMVAVPRTVAFVHPGAVWGRSLLLMGIALLGGVLGSWFLARRLGGSVAHLDGVAQRIAAGDFTPVPPKPMHSAEFADLQTAIGSMLQQFNSTRAALDAQMGEERRIRQELESLQGQVIRQERLAAVGQLVSGVAHEINNPLQAILGFAELLQLQRDVPDGVKGDLKLIQKESARACAIIRNLAMFARQQPGPAGPVHMTDVIRSVAELRQRRLESEDIELHIEDGARHPVKAVLTELQQVVLNFVVNAEQAIIASGRLPGRITIRTYDESGRVVLEVEDTGPGIPSENEAKLFQPFFTTKPVGQGTGLGLSISYGIIESLGGGIGYRRAPAGGAIFYFDLAATEDTRAPHAD